MAMEKKNKRRIRASDGGCNSSGDGEGGVYSAAPVLPHDLVAAELLTRLPAKSLMRFKCVSKLWRSTILDPGFCKAHKARSCPRGRCTGLLIVSPDEEHQGLGFFLATPSSRPVVVLEPPFDDKPLGPDYRDVVFDLLHHQFTLSNRAHDGVTDVAAESGHLVCLYTANRAWLCSVSTGEIMELPPPSPSSENSAAAIYYKYYLGYGYCIERFKLLRVSSIQGALSCISQCEILTLGGEQDEASWRKLDGVPPIHIIGGNNDNSVYINGARYWWHSSGCFLVRFCFEDEEFQVIELPSGFPELGGSLHEFRGLVALVTGVMDRKLHLWLLCRKCDDEEEWSEEWSGHTLHIPYAFADRGCCLLGNLPTGLMLMTGTIEQEDEQQHQQQLDEEEAYNSARFSSKSKYMFGKVTTQIKIVEGDFAGTVTPIYVSFYNTQKIRSNLFCVHQVHHRVTLKINLFRGYTGVHPIIAEYTGVHPEHESFQVIVDSRIIFGLLILYTIMLK